MKGARRMPATAAVGFLANKIASGAVNSVYNYAKNKISAKFSRKKVASTSNYRRKKVAYTKINPKSSIKKRLRTVERHVKNDEGTLIYRYAKAATLRVATASKCIHGAYSSNYSAYIEQVLGQLRYFNPATPGTLTTVDLTSGTNQKEVQISCRGSMQLTNNYQTPAMVCLYLLRPKVDTDTNPVAAITNGMADTSSGPLTDTSITVYPTDSCQFNDLWIIEKSVRKVLSPGKTCMLSYSTKEFSYDPSFSDTHALTYQKSNQAKVFLVRIQGTMGHDTTVSTEQGTLLAGVDIAHSIKYVVKYPAGVKMDYYIENSDYDTFTNAGVVSSKPVADNLSYSVV